MENIQENFILKILRKYTGYILLMLHLKDKENAKNLVIFDHNIVTKSQICNLNKFTRKELYLIFVDVNTVKPTTQDYFENLFDSFDFNWKNFFF